MTMQEPIAVVGVFAERDQAEQAVNGLLDAGFNVDQIGVISHGATGDVAELKTSQSHMEEGALAGGAIGGLVGAAAVSLIPGVGPIIGSGILAATLGAAMGAAGGLWIGALTDIGVPESEAKYYESEVRSGRTLVVVRPNGRAREAESVLRRYGARNTDRRGDMTQAA